MKIKCRTMRAMLAVVVLGGVFNSRASVPVEEAHPAGGRTGGSGQAQMRAESAIRTSFFTLQQCFRKGDADGILRQMSPGTLNIFKNAIEFGEDPDAWNAEELSQLEVLMGFQCRLFFGTNGLASQSATDLFEWSVKSGIVQIGNLSSAVLRDLKVEGDTATACMEVGGNLMTNAPLSFSKHDGEWKFDLNKILLASESQLAVLRAERRLSKTETAVIMLEGAYRNPLPVLRELLVKPGARRQIVALKAATPAQVHDAVIGELSAGRQDHAEAILSVYTGIHTNDQRLAFAQAVCTRSRFNTQQADEQFRRVFAMDPRTAEGHCARFVLELDDQNQVDNNFTGLRLLAADNPENPFFHWMIGIQCRDYYRHTSRKDRSAEGFRAYQRVLELFDVGPVLVHQTYANILSEELDRNEEALVQRRIAVELEPKAWTYDGMANTLSAMKKYDEANVAYAKSTELVPNDAEYWLHWSGSLYNQGRFEDCISKSKTVLAIDPGSYLARYYWGMALEAQAKRKKALEQYEEAIRLNPANPDAYISAARVLKILGDEQRSQEILDKISRIMGNEQPVRNDEGPSPPASEGSTGVHADPLH